MTIIDAPATLALPLSVGPLNLRALDAADLPQVIDLQETVYRRLPEQKKSFIVLKTPEAFLNMLHPPHCGVGIFTADDRLVAQAFLKIGHSTDLAGLTDTPATKLLAQTSGSFGVAQGMLVHPQYRGLHLMGQLLDWREAWARHLNLDTVLTEVAVGNNRSSNCLDHHGYRAAGTAIDIDGTHLVFLKKALRSQGYALKIP